MRKLKKPHPPNRQMNRKTGKKKLESRVRLTLSAVPAEQLHSDRHRVIHLLELFSWRDKRKVNIILNESR